MFDDVSDCCGFSDIDISQGSVAAFEMCWDILLSLCWKFTAKSVGESILKIDQHSTESYQNLVALFPDMVKNLPSPSPSKKSERIDTTAQFCCSDVEEFLLRLRCSPLYINMHECTSLWGAMAF